MCQRREAGGGRIDQIPKGEIRYGFHGSKARAEVMPLEEAKLIRCCSGYFAANGRASARNPTGLPVSFCSGCAETCPSLGQAEDSIRHAKRRGADPWWRGSEGRQKLCAEAFSAGTAAGGIGVTDLEAGFLEGLDIIQLAAGDVENAFGIDDDSDSGAFDQDIAVRGTILEIHFVLESGASSAHDGYPEYAVGGAPFLEQVRHLTTCGWSDADDAFISDSVAGGGGLGNDFGCNHVDVDH
jgi:hypothetical protein